VVKVRDDQPAGDYRDQGWYRHPEGTVARRVSTDPDFGAPKRRGTPPGADAASLPRSTRSKAHSH